MSDIFTIDTISELFDTLPEQKQGAGLQNDEKWENDRKGRFTGSDMHKLMGVGRSNSKKDWDRPEKIIDLNETAKKYIYEKAKERQRDRVIKSYIGYNGTYGKICEALTKKKLLEKAPGAEIKEHGFVEFIKGVAGASPDGEFFPNLTPEKLSELKPHDTDFMKIESMALEIKSAMGTDPVYLKFEKPFIEKHPDFWQVQTEMLALKTAKCLYVVAEPSTDKYEPEIEYINEKIIDASPLHQNAIMQRCLLSDDIINLYLQGVNFEDAVIKGCSEFKFKTKKNER